MVADHSFVLVRKHGSSTKYRAEVKAVGHECDLAILIIGSEEFWDGMNPLELGDIPFLQEAVAVVGYPQGNNDSTKISFYYFPLLVSSSYFLLMDIITSMTLVYILMGEPYCLVHGKFNFSSA